MSVADRIRVVVRVKPLEDESQRCLDVEGNSLRLVESTLARPYIRWTGMRFCAVAVGGAGARQSADRAWDECVGV